MTWIETGGKLAPVAGVDSGSSQSGRSVHELGQSGARADATGRQTARAAVREDRGRLSGKSRIERALGESRPSSITGDVRVLKQPAGQSGRYLEWAHLEHSEPLRHLENGAFHSGHHGARLQWASEQTGIRVLARSAHPRSSAAQRHRSRLGRTTAGAIAPTDVGASRTRDKIATAQYP